MAILRMTPTHNSRATGIIIIITIIIIIIIIIMLLSLLLLLLLLLLLKAYLIILYGFSIKQFWYEYSGTSNSGHFGGPSLVTDVWRFYMNILFLSKRLVGRSGRGTKNDSWSK